MLTINGVNVKPPSELQVTRSDIDGQTTRNARGDLIRDRVAIKTRLELKWPPMRTNEISTLLNAVKNPFFTVRFLDPYSGSFQTKTMYVGDRTAPMYKYGNGGNDVIWEELSMNFIER